MPYLPIQLLKNLKTFSYKWHFQHPIIHIGTILSIPKKNIPNTDWFVLVKYYFNANDTFKNCSFKIKLIKYSSGQ